MKRVLFLFLITVVSCNFDKKCKDSITLNSDIFIYGWDKNHATIKKAVIYEYKKTDYKNELNSHLINDFVNPFVVSNKDELHLRTSGLLKTKYNYKLVLNDTLIFKISDFEIGNIERGTAVTVQKYCVMKSYKVNGNNISQKSNHLQFDSSLGIVK
ncbi:hypothetical protein A8C32_05390 [Flavivirga aquatica]|uniref:Uncharacterized protein n=1 Tax=Flavivirga aquatica TaxID=1849968 RepID=A0A1E5SHN8_9FLAO|nr:hypothetical protein [Flavivirga aquatica]OEJ98633.1 hypothetical protein A8C32_05390 [Flavivirga aquatica]